MAHGPTLQGEREVGLGFDTEHPEATIRDVAYGVHHAFLNASDDLLDLNSEQALGWQICFRRKDEGSEGFAVLSGTAAASLLDKPTNVTSATSVVEFDSQQIQVLVYPAGLVVRRQCGRDSGTKCVLWLRTDLLMANDYVPVGRKGPGMPEQDVMTILTHLSETLATIPMLHKNRHLVSIPAIVS